MLEVLVDTDPDRLEIEAIHRFLTTSYWAAGIPLAVVRRSIAGSLCFGAYAGGGQVGFARVVTDYATFAYVADVFVIEEYRGRGIAGMLMKAIRTHPALHGLRRWMLATRDAHGLYEKYGFKPLTAPERFMELHDPGVYGACGSTANRL